MSTKEWKALVIEFVRPYKVNKRKRNFFIAFHHSHHFYLSFFSFPPFFLFSIQSILISMCRVSKDSSFHNFQSPIHFSPQLYEKLRWAQWLHCFNQINTESHRLLIINQFNNEHSRWQVSTTYTYIYL